MIFRPWNRCGQLAAQRSRPCASSRAATRYVSHSSEESVGQWRFASTAVVSVRIVEGSTDSAAAAPRPSASLIRFHVSGALALKHRSKNVKSVTAFFRTRRKSCRKALSASRTPVSRSESPSTAWKTNARRIVSEVKSPFRPRRSPRESFRRS